MKTEGLRRWLEAWLLRVWFDQTRGTDRLLACLLAPLLLPLSSLASPAPAPAVPAVATVAAHALAVAAHFYRCRCTLGLPLHSSSFSSFESILLTVYSILVTVMYLYLLD